MRKIYCKDCKFYQGRDTKELNFPLAGYTQGCEIIIDCVIPKISGFGNSKLVNVNNDCMNFKRKRWWKK